MRTSKNFPNGFQSWVETHAEICIAIGGKLETKMTSTMKLTQETSGRCGHWSSAYYLTDKFEKQYQGVKFGEELDFFDTIEKFITENL